MADAVTKISETAMSGSSVTLTSIPQIYDDLVLMIHTQSDDTSSGGGNTNTKLYYNAGTLGSGSERAMYQSGTSAGWYQTVNGYLTTTTATIDTSSNTGTGYTYLYMPAYADTSYAKTFRFITGCVTQQSLGPSNQMWQGFWVCGTTTALSSLQIDVNAGSYTSGSQCSLYGIKGP